MNRILTLFLVNFFNFYISLMIQIIKTEDGSHTVHSDKFDATYHSSHGSIQETQTVFINAGFKYICNQGFSQISILEIGFGTGLNALMTWLEAKKQPLSVLYHSLELYPIGIETARKLNYPELLKAPESEEIFMKMHAAENLTVFIPISNVNSLDFQLKIKNFELENFDPIYHLVYFDAFAPNVQPQLWQEAFLQKMYDSLIPGGVLVTYCAQGAFKRALKAVGFRLDPLPGPIGKREMTRAIKL